MVALGDGPPPPLVPSLSVEEEKEENGHVCPSKWTGRWGERRRLMRVPQRGLAGEEGGGELRVSLKGRVRRWGW